MALDLSERHCRRVKLWITESSIHSVCRTLFPDTLGKTETIYSL
jgi:hypothetical protein